MATHGAAYKPVLLKVQTTHSDRADHPGAHSTQPPAFGSFTDDAALWLKVTPQHGGFF